MFVRFVQALVGIFCATALFWVGIAWEHRPAGWPSVHFLWFNWSVPDGPYAQLAADRAREAQDALLARRVVTARAVVTQASQASATASQAAIRFVTHTIIQKVPVYVTPDTDSRYPVPWGIVRLHDAAALGVPPASISLPPGSLDGQASPIAASALTARVASNYGECRLDQDRLTRLQDWIAAQQAVKTTP